ncbi:hypothetical protein RND81_01G105800 [Saponaria officinalis]|uniref:Myb-like domain-containing protein n=1 Tax=Saponaria officinalis TaxID=3572 RepID=A0AAW1NEF9_SAPOF
MDDHHHTSSGEKTNEIQTTTNEVPKKRRSRGPSKLEKLEGKGPFSLQWDTTGCPTGQYATSFASYCGKRVRCQVNINFHDWDKDVEVGLKNLLWEDISNKYQVNERHKEYVVSYCGSKWRDFKSKLTNKWIWNKHLKYNSPADCYSYIEQADWEKFKTSCETNEFKVHRF